MAVAEVSAVEIWVKYAFVLVVHHVTGITAFTNSVVKSFAVRISHYALAIDIKVSSERASETFSTFKQIAVGVKILDNQNARTIL